MKSFVTHFYSKSFGNIFHLYKKPVLSVTQVLPIIEEQLIFLIFQCLPISEIC